MSGPQDDDASAESRELRRRCEHAERLLQLCQRDRQLTAFEIHDGVLQSLTAAVMYLDAALAHLPEGADVARDHLRHAGQLARTAIAEARRVMEGIRPPLLDSYGLAVAAEKFIEQFQHRTGIDCQLQMEMQSERLVPTLESATYRILQESLTNVERHSGSPRVSVVLREADDRLTMQIQDWGKGFDPNQVSRDRYGVRGIRERAELAGGHARIESAIGQGTRIVVELPLNDQLLDS